MKKGMALVCALLLMISCAAVLAEQETVWAEDEIDLDLTWMSGTMVYAEIYNMLYDPDAYLGKVIRLSGWYDAFQDQFTGNRYFTCYIPDAAACCAQGIEFVWAGEHLWPDDYPALGADVTVTGRLESYEENGWTYLHLVDAEVEWSGS